MKTNHIKSELKFLCGALALIKALILPTIAAAEFGAEGGGGGQIIDVDSGKELLDLVTHAVCDWKTGDQLLAHHPDFNQRIITPLRRLDWYFAGDILKQARTLQYCFTGQLSHVRPVDNGSPVRPPSQRNTFQAGFRLGNTVYLNSDFFNAPSVPESTRSFLLLHEIVHSYLPMEIFERQLKLRSMVKAISRVAKGEIRTREQLHFEMSANEIQFPQTVAFLDEFRLPLEFLLAPPGIQRERFTELTEIDSLLDLPIEKINQNLSFSDRKDLLNSPPQQRLEAALFSLLESEDLNGFKKLLNDSRFKRLNPFIVALDALETFSTEKVAYVLSQDTSEEMIQSLYRPFMNVKLTLLEDGRVALEPQTNAGLGASDSIKALLDLRSPDFLPESFGALSQILIHLARSEQWDAVNSFAGAKTPFLQTIELKSIHKAITEFQFTYPVESKLADLRIALIAQRIRELMTAKLRTALPSDQFKKLSQMIFN